MSEWVNRGDAGFFDYGGVMARESEEYKGEYEFFQLLVEELDGETVKFAFHGVCDLADQLEKKDIIKELTETAIGCGYNNLNEYIEEDPYDAVATLLSYYGYGAMEFSARNYLGTGEYSLDYNDFRLNDEQLVGFMREVGVPEHYYKDKLPTKDAGERKHAPEIEK